MNKKTKVSATEQYFNLCEEYKEKYGEKTFLLYQIGSFFEVYAMEGHETLDTLNKFAELCGGLATPRKKARFQEREIRMAGFRDYQLEKYIEKLHPHGYTVVVYDQFESEPGIIGRKLLGIYSPGTTFIDESPTLSNNTCCVWIKKTKMFNSKERYVFGLSSVNIISGSSEFSEYEESYYHNPTTYDCIENFIHIHNPLEFILIHNLEDNLIQDIIQYLNVPCKKHHIISVNDKNHSQSKQAIHCEDVVYQNQVISQFFPNININVFTYDMQNKPIGFQSYCFLLNFIQQHNPCLTEKISEPKIQQIQDTLICANHSFKQLNIFHQDNNQGVLCLLNQCRTKMGKRFMNDILLHPINNKERLEDQYTIVEKFLKKNYDFYGLKDVCDLEKYLTKLKLHRLTPRDIFHIYKTNDIIKKITKKITKKKDKIMYNALQLDDIHKMMDSFDKYIQDSFHLSLCERFETLDFYKKDEEHDFTNETFINLNINKDLKDSMKRKLENKDKLDVILNYIESLFPKKTNEKQKSFISVVKLDYVITKNRSKILNECIQRKVREKSHIQELSFESSYSGKKETFQFNLKNIKFVEVKSSNVSIQEPLFNELVMNISTENSYFYDLLKSVYENILQHIYETYYDHLVSLIHTIKYLDMYDTKARLVKKYNLCRPQIREQETSFVNAKKMRHILIEAIETQETYVPNDVALGIGEDQQGILLYGTNAVGKTSLIKALGICVIMAQSGFYVPCESFLYCPYDYIFTRIIGNDNIFKGLSTFGVEMSEMRVILNQCNERSLILGDELCSGTEIDSALSIFISGLETMTKRQCSFIFATHFHELQNMPSMKELDMIKSKHLKVQYDHERQSLYYDRRIHDGPGESIYGLEVCKSLQLPDEFLNRCHEIRNDHMKNRKNVLLMKASKYNSNKLRHHMCEYCNEEPATEIHHLKYQKNANQNEYIENSFHKNHSANLASICEKCHDHIHALNLVFEKRKTMDGTYELILLKKN